LHKAIELVNGRIQTKPGVPKEFSISYDAEGKIVLGSKIKDMMNVQQGMLLKTTGIANAFSTPELYRYTLGRFATNMMSSDYDNLKTAHQYIKTHFLSNGDDTLKYSNDRLPEIGIVRLGSKIPRLFKQYVIDKSAKDYKGLDIDDKPFTEKPVGGHIISDFELSTLNDEQRSEAFLSEGLGSKFSHDKNCRAMSSYHNLRMSILRLSEYMEIINESDDVVKKAIYDKKTKVKEFIK
jgi:hypothetical protein